MEDYIDCSLGDKEDCNSGAGKILGTLTYEKDEDFFELKLISLDGLHCVVKVKNFNFSVEKKAVEILSLPIFKKGGSVEFACMMNKNEFKLMSFSKPENSASPQVCAVASAIALTHHFSLQREKSCVAYAPGSKTLLCIRKDNSQIGLLSGRYEFSAMTNYENVSEKGIS